MRRGSVGAGSNCRCAGGHEHGQQDERQSRAQDNSGGSEQGTQIEAGDKVADEAAERADGVYRAHHCAGAVDVGQ